MVVRRICDTLEKALRIGLVLLMFISVGSTFGQVIMRYVFNAPLVWAEEAARYSLIWMTMLGAAVATRKLGHISIDSLLSRLGAQSRRHVDTVMDLLTLGLCLLLLWLGVQLAIMTADAVSTGIKIAMSWVYAAMPAGFFFMVIFVLERIYNRFGHPGNPDSHEKGAA